MSFYQFLNNKEIREKNYTTFVAPVITLIGHVHLT